MKPSKFLKKNNKSELEILRDTAISEINRLKCFLSEQEGISKRYRIALEMLVNKCMGTSLEESLSFKIAKNELMNEGKPQFKWREFDK